MKDDKRFSDSFSPNGSSVSLPRSGECENQPTVNPDFTNLQPRSLKPQWGVVPKKVFSHISPPSKFYQISNLNLLIIQILWFCQHTHAHLGCGGLLDRTPSQRIKCEKVEEKNIILRSIHSYNKNSMRFFSSLF